MTGIQVSIECPRCHRILLADETATEVECICHLYCLNGIQPSDCHMVWQEYGKTNSVGVPLASQGGNVGFPEGAHFGHSDFGDDVMHRAYYCTVHGVFSYKQAQVIPVDAAQFKLRRAPKKLRAYKQY